MHHAFQIVAVFKFADNLVDKLVHIQNRIVVSVDQRGAGAFVDFVGVAGRREFAFGFGIAFVIRRPVAADGMQD